MVKKMVKKTDVYHIFYHFCDFAFFHWALRHPRKKNGFKKKKLEKFLAEDRTAELKVISYHTRPLHQKNLLEIWARKNALSIVGNYCSKTKAAGVSKLKWAVQIFKSHPPSSVNQCNF